MRPVSRYLLWLALASVLAISFRLAEEAVGFQTRFGYPPGWYAAPGTHYEVAPGPDSLALTVRGTIQQQVALIEGAYRPVRVSVHYRAPAGGAWLALVGDVTTSRDLTIEATPTIPVPVKPDRGGMYRIPLPASGNWANITLVAHEHTDIPRLTLYLGGDTSANRVQFADPVMAYADTPGDNMLRNPRFTTNWPAWVKFPEWIPPGISVGWAPARLLALLALVSGCLLARWMARHKEGTPPAALTWPCWISLAALTVVGAGGMTELAQTCLASSANRAWLGAATDFTWILQVVVLVGVGRLALGIVGPAARFGGPLVVAGAALAMTPGIGILLPEGGVTSICNTAQFTEGFGPLWLLTCAAAVWGGVAWGVERNSHPTPQPPTA